jgi:hypothetical protein
MRAAVLCLLALQAGCDGTSASDKAKLNDARYRATLESRGVGRFQLVPAANDYPPLLLDTVTGCVDVISKSGNYAKSPVFSGGSVDHACLGDMPRDTERQVMETLRK